MTASSGGPLTVQEIAAAIHADVEGDASLTVAGFAPLESAQSEHISFLDNELYVARAGVTRAGAVIVNQEHAADVAAGAVKLVVKNPYVAFARALQLFHPQTPPKPGLSNQSVVSGSAQIDPTARLEPGVVAYANSKIGARTHIGAGTIIGEGVSIGDDCVIAPHVTLLNAKIGNNCLIHAGVRIGQDGFGFAQDGGELVKVPQVGAVVIGNNVEIGANTTIDRGAMADTTIGDNCKLDCQVQIGHNVRLGKGCRIVAQVGIAGSTVVGDGVVIGGQSGLAGHIQVADYVMIAARSGVTKTIEQPRSVVAGFPAMPMPQWRKLQALLRRMAKHGKVLPAPTPATVTVEKDSA